MKLNDKLSVLMIIFLLSILVILPLLNEPEVTHNEVPNSEIVGVSQGIEIDLQVSADEFWITDKVEPYSASLLENITILAKIYNKGATQANEVLVLLYLEKDGIRTEVHRKSIFEPLGGEDSTSIEFYWVIPADIKPGDYNLVMSVKDSFTGTDANLTDNEASKPITIKPVSILELSVVGTYTYPGRQIELTATLYNTNNTLNINTTLAFYYYLETDNKSESQKIGQKYLEVARGKHDSVNITWEIDEAVKPGSYYLWVNITDTDSANRIYMNAEARTLFKIVERPDTSKEPVYFQLWFIVGLVALIIFFLTIILSLIGVIPQDRLPIQPALVVMALVIMIIAFIGNYFDPKVHLIGPQDIAGMVIIHPITALTAGFLVAGGLEAAGAFAAAADALGRIEKLKFKGKTIFGFVGTVVILTNIPTLIAMPCGRILGAALMPAALFFGYRVAKQMGDARMVGVVVFPFIVNAAASCGPSPLGGIGTIGEGLSKMPIGSFTTAQSTGIMICTGICALFMRFITPMRPADLSDEDIKRELEAEKKAISDEIAAAKVDLDKDKDRKLKKDLRASDSKKEKEGQAEKPKKL